MYKSITPIFRSLVIEFLNDKEIRAKIDSILTQNALVAHQLIIEKENQKKLLTVAETAKLFGKSKVCIHDWANKGILIRHKIKGSSSTYFKYSEVMQALIEMKQFKTKI